MSALEPQQESLAHLAHPLPFFCWCGPHLISEVALLAGSFPRLIFFSLQTTSSCLQSYNIPWWQGIIRVGKEWLIGIFLALLVAWILEIRHGSQRCLTIQLYAV